MKKKVVSLLISFVLVVALFVGCGCSVENSATADNVTAGMREWVSPDGVHYWVSLYKMAPRYDSNGNLVIDEQ